MKNFVSAVAACAVFATSLAATTVPASSDQRDGMRDREQAMQEFCKKSRDCRTSRGKKGDRDEARRKGGRDWDEARRKGGRDHDDHGDTAAAALFGFAAGAILSGALSAQNHSHVQACAARYRSYDPVTDTYLAYSGIRYRCRL